MFTFCYLMWSRIEVETSQKYAGFESHILNDVRFCKMGISGHTKPLCTGPREELRQSLQALNKSKLVSYIDCHPCNLSIQSSKLELNQNFRNFQDKKKSRISISHEWESCTILVKHTWILVAVSSVYQVLLPLQGLALIFITNNFLRVYRHEASPKDRWKLIQIMERSEYQKVVPKKTHMKTKAE